MGNVHGCEQRCLNVAGGYNCSCFDGYRLNDEDFTTCDGIVPTKKRIIKNSECQRYNITQNYTAKNYILLVPLLRGIECMSRIIKHACMKFLK